MDEISDFINNYKNADESRICFSWNGLHGEQFVDGNMEFRELILEAALRNLSSAPLVLIRDLFRAETRCAKEAWGVADGIGELAECLLRRGGTKYLYDFLEGKHQCFDANQGSAFEYDIQLARTMLKAAEHQVSLSPDSPDVKLWRFSGWVAKG